MSATTAPGASAPRRDAPAANPADARRLRALFVHSGNMFGGVEGLLIALARHRAASPGFDPEFALSFPGRLSDALTAAGVVVHDVGAARFRRPDLVWRARRAVARLLRTRAIDVVVTQSGWSHAIVGGVASKAEVPVVRWAHGLPNRRHWLDRLAERRPPRLVIANSDFTAGHWRAACPGVEVRRCYGPVALDRPDDSAQARARVRSAVSSDTVVIAQVGRFEALKGHRAHLDALSRLPAKSAWECWMVGAPHGPAEDRYVADLRQAATRLGLEDRVRWLGERRDIPDVLAAADVYCQPNIGPDTFGLTFLEAMAAGLPVVTTAIGGGAEVVPPTCGRLVPPGDAEALAGVLSSLVADADLRRRLGAAGPGYARQLVDPATQVPAFVDLLRLAARRPQPGS